MGRRNDDEGMSEQPAGRPAPAGAGARLLALYDHALPQVYGYLLARCGQRAVAEDLTAETFLAAVDAVRADYLPMRRRKRCQSKHGPGSVLRAGAISEWPTISSSP